MKFRQLCNLLNKFFWSLLRSHSRCDGALAARAALRRNNCRLTAAHVLHCSVLSGAFSASIQGSTKQQVAVVDQSLGGLSNGLGQKVTSMPDRSSTLIAAQGYSVA